MTDEKAGILQLSNFPPLFKNNDVHDILQQREQLAKKDKSILREKSCKCTIDNLSFFSGQHRYSITSDDVTFEALFIDNPHSDRLYVSLSSAAHSTYPMFRRWSYAQSLNAKFLCIDDPMFENYELKITRWFYGTSTKSYLLILVLIIQKTMEKLGILPENVIFLGSSAGGYAALYLANEISGTNAFALAPQIAPGLWWEGRFVDSFKKEYGIDLLCDDVFHRNNIVLTNTKSKFFIAFNILSPRDDVQIEQFFKNQGFSTTQYGITQHGNIILWLHSTDGESKHSSFPEKLELRIMEFLLDEMQRGADISSFTNFSQIISEYMNTRYYLINEIKKREKSIIDQQKILEKQSLKIKKLKKSRKIANEKAAALAEQLQHIKNVPDNAIRRCIAWLFKNLRIIK